MRTERNRKLIFVSVISTIPMIIGLTMQDNKSACLSELES
jgi:hypothetical protein